MEYKRNAADARDLLDRGAAAIDQRSFDEAVDAFRGAAAAAGSDPNEQALSADAWLEAAAVHVRLGDWVQAAKDIARSRDIAHALGDAARIAAAENLGGVAEFERGNWHEASRRFASAREYAGVADDPGLLIEIESNDGRLWSELGDVDRAAESFRWVVSRFETFDASGAGPRLLCNIGIALSSVGRHADADALFERALGECKQRHDLHTGSQIMLHRVRLALEAEDVILAHSLATRVSAFCEWLSDPQLKAETALLLGSIEGRMQNWEAAEASLRDALSCSVDGQAPRCEAEAWAELGEIYTLQGRPEDALEAWTAARSCYRSLGAHRRRTTPPVAEVAGP